MRIDRQVALKTHTFGVDSLVRFEIVKRSAGTRRPSSWTLRQPDDQQNKDQSGHDSEGDFESAVRALALYHAIVDLEFGSSQLNSD